MFKNNGQTKVMSRILVLLLSLSLICGCRSVNVNNSVPSTQPNTELLGMRYNSKTKTFYEDAWDKFWNSVKAGTEVVTVPKVIFVWLCSNIEIFNSRPEELNTDIFDSITIVIIVFRWSF